MAIQNLKTCPRCDGRLLIKREANGWYEECTKCGEKTDISERFTQSNLRPCGYLSLGIFLP